MIRWCIFRFLHLAFYYLSISSYPVKVFVLLGFAQSAKVIKFDEKSLILPRAV